MNRSALRMLFGGMLLSLTFSAHSIPILELVVDNSSGAPELQGAKNVNVGGFWYDVSFMDGTCIGLFSGCDDNSDFFVDSNFDAFAASQALLDQVFLDSPLGPFDTDATLTRGCSGPFGCSVFTPVELVSLTFPSLPGAPATVLDGVSGVTAMNNFVFPFPPSLPPVCTSPTCAVLPIGPIPAPIPVDGVSANGFAERDLDSAFPYLDGGTFAVWSASPQAIPEPSTLALFGLGLLGLGWSRSRRSS